MKKEQAGCLSLQDMVSYAAGRRTVDHHGMIAVKVGAVFNYYVAFIGGVGRCVLPGSERARFQGSRKSACLLDAPSLNQVNVIKQSFPIYLAIQPRDVIGGYSKTPYNLTEHTRIGQRAIGSIQNRSSYAEIIVMDKLVLSAAARGRR
ncbi:hypothetical protein [Bartonella sp. DGB2]|uniref:hypothetical protein n=1 Tax=Bartonella sp. DGB2 TaxID=3388426 RepID=UPI00398FBD8A